MSPALEDAERITIRFSYTKPELIPPRFYAKRNSYRDREWLGDEVRASVAKFYADLNSRGFVLTFARTDRVRYRSGVTRYETRFVFVHESIPDLPQWTRMREAFFTLADAWTWRTFISFDEEREQFRVFCEQPRAVTRARGPIAEVRSGDFLLQPAL